MKKLIIFFFFILSISANALTEEYYKIKDIQKQKEYFFKHLYPLIKKENKLILEERNFIISYLSENPSSLDSSSKKFEKLLKLKEKYKIKNISSKEEYLKKIDIIPPSLALAQAALESGWGKSRFTKEANNIFGHWTYNAKVGLVPKDRAQNAKHFIRIFESLSHSIKKYMLNLNSNRAYKSFQEKRYIQRLKGEKLNSLLLSQTLINYSGIGERYLKILKSIIVENKLQKYDR